MDFLATPVIPRKATRLSSLSVRPCSSINQYTNINGAGPGYDSNFNLTGFNGFGATYISANQMTSASNNGSNAQFYDGLGRRVKRTVNGATTVIAYDGWKPTVEWDGNGNFQAWNVYGAGPDEILWRCQTGVDHLRYHHDARGNVAFVLGGGGQGYERYTYDAFGQPTITDWDGNVRSQSAIGNRFMFQGREWINELGIYDFRNRYYHPQLGRFLQKDPTGFAAGDANLFRYCGGDPVKGRDPYGLEQPHTSKPPPPKRKDGNDGNSSSVNFGSNGYTPTGSLIPQTLTGTWNGSSWDLSTHDYIHGTNSIGSFVLVGFGNGNGGNAEGGGAQFVSTSTPFGRAIEVATKAIEEWASWTAQKNKEVAGTVTSSGEIIVGPERDRTTLTSNPGPISADTLAVWHLHPTDLPNNLSPYRFSWKDQRFIDNHPNLPFVVGVPDGPPGQFTIFAWTPETPYYHYERVGPNTPRH